MAKKIKEKKVLYTIGNYRVSVFDELNLVVEELRMVEKKDAPNQEEWKIYGYYGDLGYASRTILRKMVEDGAEDITDLKELISIVKNTEEAVRQVTNKWKK